MLRSVGSLLFREEAVDTVSWPCSRGSGGAAFTPAGSFSSCSSADVCRHPACQSSSTHDASSTRAVFYHKSTLAVRPSVQSLSVSGPSRASCAHPWYRLGRALQLPVCALPCAERPFNVLRSQLSRCCKSSVANIGDTVECAQCSMNRDPVAKTRTRPRHEHPRWPKRYVRAGVSVTKC